ncbi:MAG TPA: hypothetical protein ENH99_02000 [Candidatus Pacearchaeota archaeon]|nr:hypothetical protein [Candidatus Pacearchaeota archaeon]
MIDSHKIKEKISVKSFMQKFDSYSQEDLEITPHAFFRLSQKQRRLYEKDRLIQVIYSTKPIEVSIHKDGRYAVIYPFEKRLLKVLFEIYPKKIYIVTFYILNKKQETKIGK